MIYPEEANPQRRVDVWLPGVALKYLMDMGFPFKGDENVPKLAGVGCTTVTILRTVELHTLKRVNVYLVCKLYLDKAVIKMQIHKLEPSLLNFCQKTSVHWPILLRLIH